MHESLHKNPQRSSNKAYVQSFKELCHQIAARDVMDATARSNKVTLMPYCLFPQFSRNRTVSFKMLIFPNNVATSGSELVLMVHKCLYHQIMSKRTIENFYCLRGHSNLNYQDKSQGRKFS